MADDPTRALSDARLLLRYFTASPWRELEVASGGLHLSISRMSAADRRARRHPEPARSVEAGLSEAVLTAPHVATLRWLADCGVELAPGEPYAALDVLDETIELAAERPMTVIARLGEVGGLLEHASPMLRVMS